jgi:hypothetical protein
MSADHRPAVPPRLTAAWSRADARAVALGLAAVTAGWLLLRALAAGVRAHPALAVLGLVLAAVTGAAAFARFALRHPLAAVAAVVAVTVAVIAPVLAAAALTVAVLHPRPRSWLLGRVGGYQGRREWTRAAAYAGLADPAVPRLLDRTATPVGGGVARRAARRSDRARPREPPGGAADLLPRPGRHRDRGPARPRDVHRPGGPGGSARRAGGRRGRDRRVLAGRPDRRGRRRERPRRDRQPDRAAAGSRAC